MSKIPHPPTQTSVVLRLGIALAKFSNFNELAKLWDRDGDGTIAKKELKELESYFRALDGYLYLSQRLERTCGAGGVETINSRTSDRRSRQKRI